MRAKVYRDGGIVIEVKDRRILLDPLSLPREKPDVVFISHAHSDHYRLKPLRALSKVPKLMSNATKELIDPRGKLSGVVTVESGESVEVCGLRLDFYDAGHVLGSLQLLIDAGIRVVYTGDFCIEQRIIMRPAPILKSDVLIIDATYGHPKYSFPPRNEVYKRVLRAVKESTSSAKGLRFAARPLGTSQELTALLSMAAKTPPFVDKRIGENNKMYEKYGEHLGTYIVHPSIPPSDTVAIVTLSAGIDDSIPCTGWALYGGIPLSSHADFDDLIRYALESGACEIFTFSAHAKALANTLTSEASIKAAPIDAPSR